MKKVQLMKVVLFLTLVLTFIGNLPSQERNLTGGTQGTMIIGVVQQTNFTVSASSISSDIYRLPQPSDQYVKDRMYQMLLSKARTEYGNTVIDVDNIRIITTSSSKAYISGIHGQIDARSTFEASANVIGIVLHPAHSSTPITETSGGQNSLAIDGAVQRAVDNAIQGIPLEKLIEVAPVATSIPNLADFINGEILFLLIDKGYKTTKESSECRLISRVDGEGSTRRLRIMVLNTTTGEIENSSSEPI